MNLLDILKQRLYAKFSYEIYRLSVWKSMVRKTEVKYVSSLEKKFFPFMKMSWGVSEW